MDIYLIFRLTGIGMIIALLCYLLDKAGRDDISLLVSVSGLIICLFMVLGVAGELISTVQAVFMLN